MWSGATQPGEGPLSKACLNARGNAMEIAVGLAWAATTDGRYLREGHTIEWNASQEAWKEAWKHFDAQGLAPGRPVRARTTSLEPAASDGPVTAETDHAPGSASAVGA